MIPGYRVEHGAMTRLGFEKEKEVLDNALGLRELRLCALLSKITREEDRVNRTGLLKHVLKVIVDPSLHTRPQPILRLLTNVQVRKV